jgi:uncharacterized LabA/DUF88 family protein
MRIRRIAILIDGSFFLKRLNKLVPPEYCDSPEAVAKSAKILCRNQVRRLIGERGDVRKSKWLDHVYRLFFYDALPFGEIAHHPILNQQIHFAKTPEAVFRNELFSALRRQRKFALRLGKVTKEDGWRIKDTSVTKKLLATREWAHLFDQAAGDSEADPTVTLRPDQIAQLRKLAQAWKNLAADDLKLSLRQKGVDMRIGIDITTLTLKKQVDTIILVTGDSDFVPAAKVARREGVEFLLDPLRQQVNDDLHEHVDGIISGFHQTGTPSNPPDEDDDTPDLPTTSP